MGRRGILHIKKWRSVRYNILGQPLPLSISDVPQSVCDKVKHNIRWSVEDVVWSEVRYEVRASLGLFGDKNHE